MAELDGATLRRMYVDEGMTVTMIAQALRVRKQTVCAALARWNIPRRRRGPRRRLPVLPFTPGELRRLVRRKGVRAVARDLNVAPDVVYAHMGSSPAPRSQKRALDDDAVWAAYQAGTPIAEIMVQHQCARHTITRSLRRSFLRPTQQRRGNQ
jgi:hypothetical protein